MGGVITKYEPAREEQVGRLEVTRWSIDAVAAALARIYSLRPRLQEIKAIGLQSVADRNGLGSVRELRRMGTHDELLEASKGTKQPLTAALLREVRSEFLLNKREFWEVFTDYTVINPDDHAFLSLPIAMFPLFEARTPAPPGGEGGEEGRSRGTGRVQALHVLCVLATLCSGPRQQQLRFLFDLFDFTGFKVLGKEELLVMVGSMSAGHAKFRTISAPFSPKASAELADTIFASADVDNTNACSFEEFLRWSIVYSGSNEFLSQLHSYHDAATSDLRTREELQQEVQAQQRGARGRVNSIVRISLALQQKLKDVEGLLSPGRGSGSGAGSSPRSPRSSMASKTSKGSGSRPTPRSPRSSVKGRSPRPRRSMKGVVGGSEGQAAQQSSGQRQAVQSKAEESGFVSITRDMFNTEEQFIKMKLRMARTREMKLKVVAGRRVMLELVQAGVKFTRKELLRLGEQFATESGMAGRVKVDAFRTLLEEHLPKLAEADDHLFQRIFATLDRDGDGTLNFREFALGMNLLLKGTLQEKIKFVFTMHDTDNSGMMSVPELVHLFRHLYQDLGDTVEFATEILQSLDVDGDGTMDPDEFARALKNEPLLLDTIGRTLAVTQAKNKAVHRLRLAAPDVFTAERLLEVLATGVHRSHKRQVLSRSQFWHWMKKYMGTPADTKSQVDAVHAAFDRDGMDRVAMKEVLLAFTQCFSDSLEGQAPMFFELFDLNGDRQLSNAEVLHLVLASAAESKGSAKKVMKSLRYIDQDQNGQISYAEFKARASRDKTLMKALHRLFDATPMHTSSPSPHRRGGRRGRRRGRSIAEGQVDDSSMGSLEAADSDSWSDGGGEGEGEGESEARAGRERGRHRGKRRSSQQSAEGGRGGGKRRHSSKRRKTKKSSSRRRRSKASSRPPHRPSKASSGNSSTAAVDSPAGHHRKLRVAEEAQLPEGRAVGAGEEVPPLRMPEDSFTPPIQTRIASPPASGAPHSARRAPRHLMVEQAANASPYHTAREPLSFSEYSAKYGGGSTSNAPKAAVMESDGGMGLGPGAGRMAAARAAARQEATARGSEARSRGASPESNRARWRQMSHSKALPAM